MPVSQVMSTNFKDIQKSSFDEMTRWYRRFMQAVAILPLDNRDYNYPATRLLLVYSLIASFIQTSSFLSYMINVRVPSIDFICVLVIMLGFNSRYYLLLWNRRALANLLEECRAIWDDCVEKEHSTVRQFERKVRLLFYIMLGSFSMGTLSYAWTALSLTLEAIRNNDTQTKYLPFEWFAEGAEDTWPGYGFNYLIEELVSLNATFITASVDIASPLLIMIGAGFFRVLQHRLYHAYENAMEHDGEPSAADSELEACLRMHQRILNYCSGIDKLSRSLFFVQLLANAYNISLVGLQLLGADRDRYRYALVIIVSFGQLFICQWAPDLLVDESTAIATVAYNVSLPWTRRSIGKELMLMIARAQRPVQMTAAGFFILSLESFREILKGAVSFFMVLRSLTA